MRYLIALVLSLFAVTGCSSAEAPFTWGQASAELAATYCSTIERCGYAVDVELCTEHASWHLCEPDLSCDVEIDGDAAREALDGCSAAAAEIDSTGCFYLAWFGALPAECAPVFDLDPGDQHPDAGA